MFITAHFSKNKDRRNTTRTDIDYDPKYDSVDGEQDHVFVSEFNVGGAKMRVYWTKDEYERFIQEGLANLQELDRMIIEDKLK